MFKKSGRDLVLLGSAWMLAFLSSHPGMAAEFFTSQSEKLGRAALAGMVGCFQLDYSFAEVEALAAGYQLHPGVYDATKHRTIKEHVMLVSTSANSFRLQRILFAEEADGQISFIMKHFGENWTYEKPWRYDYVGDETWEPLANTPGARQWTREVTALDDGPRYQCAAAWEGPASQPEWRCSTFAPIPGRETRDMGRHDYQALERTSRLISYPWGSLEREENTKVALLAGEREALAREEGKVFSIRLADEHCRVAEGWALERAKFWSFTRAAWEKALDGSSSFQAFRELDGVPLYAAIAKLEAAHYKDLYRPEIARLVEEEIATLIEKYRR